METCSTCNRTFSRIAMKVHRIHCATQIADNPRYAQSRQVHESVIIHEPEPIEICLQQAVLDFIQAEQSKLLRTTFPDLSVVAPSPRTLFENARQQSKQLKLPVLTPTPRDVVISADSCPPITKARVKRVLKTYQPDKKSWF